jgi:hypothetical protein
VEYAEPQSKNLRSNKKPRRVSQRRELAVVTLATVASISGVGGLLAAHQYGISQSVQPAGATERPAAAVPNQPSSVGAGSAVSAPASSRENEHEEIVDDGGEHAVLRSARVKPAQNDAPSWSAASQKSAPAVSRGTTPL